MNGNKALKKLGIKIGKHKQQQTAKDAAKKRKSKQKMQKQSRRANR